MTMESKWETWISTPNWQQRGDVPHPSPSHHSVGSGGQLKLLGLDKIQSTLVTHTTPDAPHFQ